MCRLSKLQVNMQLLPREGSERVRESQLLFQIKVCEETVFFFIFFFISFFFAYFIACARVAAALPDGGVRRDAVCAQSIKALYSGTLKALLRLY